MPQEASVSGGNNVVVQVVGDGNSILAEFAHLTLTRYLNRRTVTEPLDGLDPLARAVPFVGRTEEIEGLIRWLQVSRPLSICVVTGLAGCGKTRLALELVEKAVALGWDAGFVESRELARFQSKQNSAGWGWQCPTLVVIDNAAAQAEMLSSWFAELADNQGASDAPLRILVVDRDASAISGWWKTASDPGGWASRAVQRMLDPDRPMRLEPIADPAERRLILAGTLEFLKSPIRPPAPGSDPAFDRALAGMYWTGRPLYLLIAAFVSAQGGVGTVLSLRRSDLVDMLAQAERGRLDRIAKASGIRADLLAHMAAYVTVCRGLPLDGLRKAILEERNALGLTAGDSEPYSMAQALSEALPAPDGGVFPVAPDIMGDAFVLATFGQQDGDAAMLRAGSAMPEKAARWTVRLAQDYFDTGREEPLRWLHLLTSREDLPVDVLQSVADIIPPLTLGLAREGTRIQAAIVAILRKEAETNAAARAKLAANLGKLSTRLSSLGSGMEAVAAAREAVSIYRELASGGSVEGSADLVSSLSELYAVLAESGQLDDALAATDEAVRICRNMPGPPTEAMRQDLAMSLNNYGNTLNDVSRPEDALTAITEAAEIFRDLAKLDPDGTHLNLARCLSNFSLSFSGLGRNEEALRTMQETIGLWRQLAASYPARFLPEFAQSMSNLGVFLQDLGRFQEAFEALNEAITSVRRVVDKDPGALQPILAANLVNSTDVYRELGRTPEAVTVSLEAVALYRGLAASNPQRYRPELSTSLGNSSSALTDAGRTTEAVAASLESVDICRELTAGHREAFVDNLAAALDTHSLNLAALGKTEEALSAAQEANGLWRALAKDHPQAFGPRLARNVNNCSIRLSELKRYEEAAASQEEAVRIYRELAKQTPDFKGDLGKCLKNLSERWKEVGKTNEAAAAAAEAETLMSLTASATT